MIKSYKNQLSTDRFAFLKKKVMLFPKQLYTRKFKKKICISQQGQRKQVYQYSFRKKHHGCMLLFIRSP